MATYYPTDTLGAGGFGTVRTVYDDDGAVFAMKSFECDDDGGVSTGTLREISMMQRLKGCHPAVLSIHDVAEVDGEIAMIMPVLRGNVPELVESKFMSNRQKITFAFNLLDAVDFLHRNGVIHRDIKTDNVLMNDDFTPVLADFSLARFWTSDVPAGPSKHSSFSATAEVGTRTYRAPEIVEGKTYGFKSDMWSVGVVLYELFSGQLLTFDKDRHTIAFLSSKVDGMPATPVSDVLKGLLDPDPLTRLSSAQAMKLPLFKSYKAAASTPLTSWTHSTEGTMASKYSKVFDVPSSYCEYLAHKMFSIELQYITDFMDEYEIDDYIEAERRMLQTTRYDLYI